MESYSQEVGDGMVQKLDINFKAKRTTLLLERWGDEEEPEQITVLFVGVELQDFKDFSGFNILHDVEEAESPAQF